MDFRHLAPFMDRVPYRHAHALRRLLGTGERVLDVGGGTGRIARRVRPDWARVVVADVEPNMLHRARARGFDAVTCDARHLPFREGAFEAAFTVDAFHHFPDQSRVLADVGRVLAEGGRFVIEELDPANWQGRLVRALESLARFGSTFHRPAALRAMAERAGLRARVTRFNRRDYAVVAERLSSPA